MDFSEYAWFALSYKPVEIGGTEELFLKFFANSESYSAYQLYINFRIDK
jgi:hypothetical protein